MALLELQNLNIRMFRNLLQDFSIRHSCSQYSWTKVDKKYSTALVKTSFEIYLQWYNIKNDLNNFINNISK